MIMILHVYSHLIPEDEDKAISLINELNKKKQVSSEGLQLSNSSNLVNNIILHDNKNRNEKVNLCYFYFYFPYYLFSLIIKWPQSTS